MRISNQRWKICIRDWKRELVTIHRNTYQARARSEWKKQTEQNRPERMKTNPFEFKSVNEDRTQQPGVLIVRELGHPTTQSFLSQIWDSGENRRYRSTTKIILDGTIRREYINSNWQNYLSTTNCNIRCFDNILAMPSFWTPTPTTDKHTAHSSGTCDQD